LIERLFDLAVEGVHSQNWQLAVYLLERLANLGGET
jgi:hypothetical protein